MKMLVKVYGGSTAYGLNTPESDIDFRGVFVNTDPSKILGLEKHEHVQKQETDDEVYYEVRKFFELLRSGNTGVLEVLFSEEMPLKTTTEFEYLIRANKSNFLDTEKIFRCLSGYIQSERRLANGERTGKLGSKRKAALEKYGFSPKNATQLLRLSWCGNVLFQKGYFPVNVKNEDENFYNKLFSIKTEPEKYSNEQLNKMFDDCDVELKNSYDSKKFTSDFDTKLANEVLRKIYLPYLQ
jgi:hypothetical protein